MNWKFLSFEIMQVTCYTDIRVQIWVHLVLKLHQPNWTFGWHLVTWLLHDSDDWHLWLCLLPVISTFLYWRKVFFILELAALQNNTNIFLMNEMPSYLYSRKPWTRQKNRSPHSDQPRIAFVMAPRSLLCFLLQNVRRIASFGSLP